ncbi:uncharacterized protein LOC126314408 [Schistocerca gregaria]|uniref:uncharacterized protein LOC126314408 n=1 Tax=Schistocerca gregaria TaxID=7010 RepID=UPI00211EF79E|nr:uncharacterized protein LOC126314408 [Schistocerca gregaria]
MAADIPSIFDSDTAEHRRLAEHAKRMKDWKFWGPYLSERQWATVREDYSRDGEAWNYFTHDQARSRAYRWGEDGLLGITDRDCNVCFALAMWNGKDPILKERLFGVTGKQGNHGEDVKELYYYLDATPTHTYMKALYKYPMKEYPYEEFVNVNSFRTALDPEYEILDTDIFDSNMYYDVFVEYAKSGYMDVLAKITIWNRSDEPSQIHFLPNIWFRNTWTWGYRHEGCTSKPLLWLADKEKGELKFQHDTRSQFEFYALDLPEEWLFTDNETNTEVIWGVKNDEPYKKDAFHRYVVKGEKDAVNPEMRGTKAAPYYCRVVAGGDCVVFRFRLTRGYIEKPEEGFEEVFEKRKQEADEFYASVIPNTLKPEEVAVTRQAYAGLLWSKQFYHYSVKNWLEGDPNMPEPPAERLKGRNIDWEHLFNKDIISMPDKWEYPWYASWDLAFHMIPLATIDPQFSKQQLILFLREWFMHPSGMIPAYEWDLSSVNPPVHAWACWNVYKIDGSRDRDFLLRAFNKLVINFTWWVNRKDASGKHIFTGGFLGLDNISVFDRNLVKDLEQADATSWMAFFCAHMLTISMELAKELPAMEDIASKFFEHFVAIIHAINTFDGTGLWDEQDGFFYDQLKVGTERFPLRIRSIVGLLPLTAVSVLDMRTISMLPGFKKRMEWVIKNRPWLSRHIEERDGKYLLSVANEEKLKRILNYVLDPDEFLSPFGIRSLSKFHELEPFRWCDMDVKYTPGEAENGMFGGNSNWRGPIWFPINFLLIESIRNYYTFFGDSFRIEFPSRSGTVTNLIDVAEDISSRCVSIFLPHSENHLELLECSKLEYGMRPCHGDYKIYRDNPHFKDLVLFYEYFHGDTGKGLGAPHQTGWTALAAMQFQEIGRYVRSFPTKRRMHTVNPKGRRDVFR